jgi:hypothetical protein
MATWTFFAIGISISFFNGTVNISESPLAALVGEV